MPVFVDYPEEKFAASWPGPTTAIRDPQDWPRTAGRCGPDPLLSYDTHNLDHSCAAPRRDLAADRRNRCRPLGREDPRRAARSRMELARHRRPGPRRRRPLIYGFRLSVLFGSPCDHLFDHRRARRRGAGLFFGGWIDLIFQRFIEIWTAIPSLNLLIHHLVDHHAELLRAPRHPAAVLRGCRWSRRAGRVSCDARTFEYVRAARALLGCPTPDHVPAPPAERQVATLTLLPFVLNGSITTLTSLDFLASPAAGSPSLGELLWPRHKANLQAPWLGLNRLRVIAVTLKTC